MENNHNYTYYFLLIFVLESFHIYFLHIILFFQELFLFELWINYNSSYKIEFAKNYFAKENFQIN